MLILYLGPPVVPFYTFSGQGSPTNIDYRRKGTLILTSPLEDLGIFDLPKSTLRSWLSLPAGQSTLAFQYCHANWT